MHRIVVVLPAPFGPRKPVTMPGSMPNVSPSTAVFSPYRFVRPCTSIIGNCPLPRDIGIYLAIRRGALARAFAVLCLVPCGHRTERTKKSGSRCTRGIHGVAAGVRSIIFQHTLRRPPRTGRTPFRLLAFHAYGRGDSRSPHSPA